jgi:hypothetical protein
MKAIFDNELFGTLLEKQTGIIYDHKNIKYTITKTMKKIDNTTNEITKIVLKHKLLLINS